MRIACPNCAAEYEVPETLLAAGPRLLRCARCSHQFEAALPGAAAPLPPEPAPASQPASQFAPEPPPARDSPGEAPAFAPLPPVFAPPEPPVVDMERPRPTRGPTRHSPIDAPPMPEEEPAEGPSRGALLLGWVISVALLAAAAWAAVHYRAAIMEAWPPATRFFQALGLG
jgi:predicted Zn finger-like uncharacterized protein